jgi:hypothetical protein
VTVLAAHRWATNAELIAHGVVPLGHLRASWTTLDPTWGLGTWWKLWRPDVLVGSDLDPTKSPTGTSVDFTALPHADRSVDVVAFDPPYKLNGTATDEVDDRYGVAGDYVTWQERHDLICRGITEAARVARHRLLLKCQDQVCSGAKRWQTREFADHAETVGLRLADRLDMLTRPRPQPAGRRQVHALQAYSTLLIFRRIGR